jgi:MoxR-like ATPase
VRVADGAVRDRALVTLATVGNSCGMRPALESPAALAAALKEHGYLADPGLATAGYLAATLGRPIFLEGDAGVGKTSFAQTLALATGLELIRLQCYEGLDAAQALYDWDFARQVLHLRAQDGTAMSTAEKEADLYSRRYLIARPLLQAIERAPCVLLVDEIDRADDEFEAYLLEVLADNAVTIPEIGRIAAENPPLVVVTSNRTREVHDALKRRCLYHWVAHPGLDREIEIVRTRLPEVSAVLAEQVAKATAQLRGMDLVKPPGVAEAIDWAAALNALGAQDLHSEQVAVAWGAVLKFREDIERVEALPIAQLLDF